MSEALTLIANLREEVGTGASRALRRKGMVPATIYGAGKQPLSIAIEEKEITKYYKRPQYISQLFEFEIGQKKYKALPQSIDLHPITEIVSHADFMFLEKEVQKMKVPVVYTNKETSIGIKRGGYFNTVKRSLSILCPITDLRRKIEVDVSAMQIGSSIKASSVSLPAGAVLLENPNLVIASIIGKRSKTDEIEEGTPSSASAADKK